MRVLSRDFGRERHWLCLRVKTPGSQCNNSELNERTLQLAKYLYAWKRVQRPRRRRRRRFSHAVSVRASGRGVGWFALQSTFHTEFSPNGIWNGFALLYQVDRKCPMLSQAHVIDKT